MSAASTYAEALFEAAENAGAVDAVRADLTALSDVITPRNEVGRVLLNPDLDSTVKKGALTALGGTNNALTVNLLQVLVDRGRLEELPEIADAFADRVNRASGQIVVEVTSAVPLTDELRSQVVARITEQTGRSAQITETVDPDILGGLVLRIGGVVTDASVRGRLRGLRKSITGIHS